MVFITEQNRRAGRRRVVGPQLRVVLHIVLGLAALLGANSLYLLSVTVLEQFRDQSFQNFFYQYMFLGHLLLGLVLILPFLTFAWVHLRRGRTHPNRTAIGLGYVLLALGLVLLGSGILLMRVEGFELRDPRLRSVTYWLHILSPLALVWLYILHRLAGPRLRWRLGRRWALVGLGLLGLMGFLHVKDPRTWRAGSMAGGVDLFEPSLARTAHGRTIPAETLTMDIYCRDCHQDAYEGWFHSAHHFSSFNNPPYLFSVRETRAVVLERDGNVKAARWCAGCHDPVPLFSGAFDDPDFDLQADPMGQVGVTCTACHSITRINSTLGNADYTIEEPLHYPFAFSTNRVLQFINRQLVKAKPEFHKRTFLKPVHQTAEFCSACHKVHIPREMNHYKDFLRGQNHYDTWLLSGVSGHGARSFYYPSVAQTNCAGCHMPLQASADFGANYFNPTNPAVRHIHDHLFPAANTALPHLRGEDEIVSRHRAYLEGALRIDIFGLKEAGRIDGTLVAPLRPEVPVLIAGRTYLLEVVLRTLRVGHPFTQGTTDSNEVWVETALSAGEQAIGHSGGRGSFGEVDPWAHFVNTYMLDRSGNRIDRRNPQDIFTPLYNHQIAPGTGQVVHYRFTVPPDQTEPLTVNAQLHYRKFDTVYLNYVLGQGYTNGAPFQVTNDLPIVTIASDTLTFPVRAAASADSKSSKGDSSAIPVWERWNDYGIGLLLKGDKGSEKGELRQAEHAFQQVEGLGRADGPLNLARVYLKEGRIQDAVLALQRAGRFDPPPSRWTVAWLTGLANKQNGFLDEAIEQFRSILEDRYAELEHRGFDFSRDYVVINELAQTVVERAKRERLQPERQRATLEEAARLFQSTLNLDSENLTAHYNLALVYAQLGDPDRAEQHRLLHERYRPDDNARDVAIAEARRRDPAANHAAQAIVIYDLQRPAD